MFKWMIATTLIFASVGTAGPPAHSNAGGLPGCQSELGDREAAANEASVLLEETTGAADDVLAELDELLGLLGCEAEGAAAAPTLSSAATSRDDRLDTSTEACERLRWTRSRAAAVQYNIGECRQLL